MLKIDQNNVFCNIVSRGMRCTSSPAPWGLGWGRVVDSVFVYGFCNSGNIKHLIVSLCCQSCRIHTQIQYLQRHPRPHGAGTHHPLRSRVTGKRYYHVLKYQFCIKDSFAQKRTSSSSPCTWRTCSRLLHS
jgi:hypothetical protein